MTVYKYDAGKVPKGKARLVVSHVAAVPPADIVVNGQVLFANIANGESLELVVPVATYKVSIVPSEKKEPVFFGPVSPLRVVRSTASTLLVIRRRRP